MENDPFTPKPESWSEKLGPEFNPVIEIGPKVTRVLSETFQQARQNLFRAVAQTLLGGCLFVLLLFGSEPDTGAILSYLRVPDGQSVLHLARWILIVGLISYVVAALYHVFISVAQYMDAVRLRRLLF